jgi:hypothetical protein
MQPRSWKCFASLAVAALLLAGAPAFAADGIDGTWEWEVGGQGGQTYQQRAKLKQDGEKLTGVIMGRNNQETEIKDGKIKDGEISFTVTRERQGQSMTTKYTGKLSGDTIKGKTERERDGQTQSRDWEAKRAKEEKKAA